VILFVKVLTEDTVYNYRSLSSYDNDIRCIANSVYLMPQNGHKKRYSMVYRRLSAHFRTLCTAIVDGYGLSHSSL